LELFRKLLGRAVLLVVGLPLLLIVSNVGGWLWAAVVFCGSVIAMGEYYSALYRRGMRPSVLLGIVASALLIVAAMNCDPAMSWLYTVMVIALVVALSMVAQMARGTVKGGVVNSATTTFGIAYVALLMTFLIRLRAYDLPGMLGTDAGRFAHHIGALLIVLVPVWFLDTAAFIVGSSCGRRKLAPTISPGKTVEGAIGGFIACIIATGLVGWWLGLQFWHIMALGALMGVVAQVGDLSKSVLKRDMEIKDFGDIFGPHGGVIDRFDSIMFASAVGYLYLVVALGAPWWLT
jgi:phosphatidate cytidylyltransferase